jgi:hypothetical protein
MCCTNPVIAQQKKNNAKNQQDTIKVDFFNGIRIDVDAAPLLTTFVNGKEKYSYEAAVQAYIKNKYYPIVELGYAGADYVTNSEANYKTNGLFGRIGVDVNLVKSKKNATPTNNLFLAGLRLGYSGFNYSLTNVSIPDEYWGGDNDIHNYNNLSASKLWFEASVGIRVELTHNIFMGWTVKYKNLFGKPEVGTLTPWYVPGFGVNDTGTTWGINYSIGYKLNIGRKPQIANAQQKSIKKK